MTDDLRTRLAQLAPAIDPDAAWTDFERRRRADRRRRGRTRLAVTAAAVVVVAVGVAALAPGSPAAVSVEGDTPSLPSPPSTQRPCVELPVMDSSMVVPPDGTYVASGVGVGLAGRDDGPDLLSFYVDNGGAGFNFANVPIADDVRFVAAGTRSDAALDSGAVADVAASYHGGMSFTVVAGVIVTVDLVHTEWEMDSGLHDCRPAG